MARSEHLPMKNRERAIPREFGDADEIGIQRGLAEFRAGRPVLIQAPDEAVVAMPIDGTDSERIAAFRALVHPVRPRLVVTARRARSLGVDSCGPVLLDLDADDDAEAVLSLAADAEVERAVSAAPAGPAATAAIELTKLVQKLPALLIAAADPASAFDPPFIAVAARAVAEVRRNLVRSLAIAGGAEVPLHGGIATRFVVFRDAVGGSPVAIVVGAPDFSQPVAIRLHSACLTGDVFGSRRCDCGDQLRLAVTSLQRAGGGVILYLEQEGRGLGLANKMRAYELQDAGLDTVDANTTLGFDDDERDYAVAARMLKILGCQRVVMLTNNPGKLEGLADAGIEIAGRLPLNTEINAHNRRYLAALATRAGHMLDGISEGEAAGPASHLRPDRPAG
jgi:GTP cyclohydrolase II